MVAKKGKQSEIVRGVLEGMERSAIAELAGSSERTLRRRLQEPKMLAAIEDARAHLHGQLLSWLQSLALDALLDVKHVLKEGNDTARLAAAKLLLDQLANHRSVHDAARVLAAELAQLRAFERLEEQR